MADPAVWITGTGPDKQLNFRLPTGGKGDKGDKGDKGADGSNVLPADTAIAAAINGSATATKTALNATILDQAGPHGISGVPTVKPLIPAVEKVGPPSIADGVKSDGTMIHSFYRAQHKLLTDEPVTMVQLQYGNYYTPGFAGEVVGDNDITIRAGVETADGIITPATFGGVREITLKPGQTAWTDPVVIKGTGTHIWSRSLVQVATLGQRWYYTNILRGGATEARPGESWEGSASAWTTDKTVTGNYPNYPTGRGGYAYGPLNILCETPDRKPIVGVIGDSIARGHQDSTEAQDGFVTNGFISRALLAAKIPHTKQAVAGDRTVDWLSREKSYRRRALLNGVQHVICEYGLNDLHSGNRAPALVQADLLTAWTEQAHQGAKVWQTTITPASTSTDSWATLANQTPMVNEANRVTVNTWIRAGAPIDPATKAVVAVGTAGALVAGQAGHPLAGYFEVADTIESARNSGKFKVTGTANGYTPDGLHPNTAGYLLMAAAIDTTKFV